MSSLVTDRNQSNFDLPFSYSCFWPNKKILTTNDLNNKLDIHLKDTLTITCLATGVYDINIGDYSCSKPCPMAPIPFPDIIQDDQNGLQFGEYGHVRT